MPTKPRTTKKPAAKPKRYVRVAVKAGKATLQESDQADRGFKPPRQPNPTAEDIGIKIGDAIGRRLGDLLDKPVQGNSNMLHFSEDRGGLDRLIEDAEAAYSKAYVPFNAGDKIAYSNPKPGRELSARMSPVDEAIGRLRSAITMAECATESTSERLCSALSPPMPTPNGEKPVVSGAGALAGILNELAERIYADSRRRNDILDRLEL